MPTHGSFIPDLSASVKWLMSSSWKQSRVARKTSLLAAFIALVLTAALGQTAAAQNSAASPIVLSEFINEHAPYASSHASTIAETTSGTLVAAWFGGSGEGHPDVGIWLARKVKGHWQPATEVANGLQPDGTRYPAWNPVLFQSPKGPLFLFYKVGPADKWVGMVTTSSDDGHTWSKQRRLPQGILGPTKDKPVVLSDGSWLSGADKDWRVHFELSRDAGRTWEFIGPVDRGAGFDAIQPTILFAGHGQLEALCRTRQGVIAITWSSDGGRTWTPLAATELPNPNSGIDAVTLADGRQLLVYNHSAHLPNFSGHGNRYPLDVAISRDGLKWKHVLTIEDVPDVPGNKGPVQLSPPTLRQKLDTWGGKGFSYPAVIQTKDRLVHITYTWNRKMIKHVVIDPRKLTPNPPPEASPSPGARTGLQLLFLGTNGGPPLHLDRSEPSTLLIVDGRPYLIDCGIGTIRRMLRANIQSKTIGTIFFTHLHSDHDLGLADVMASDFGTVGDSSPVVNIYGPPQTEAFVKAAFE